MASVVASEYFTKRRFRVSERNSSVGDQSYPPSLAGPLPSVRSV
jgi:hypothetical protein